MGTRALRKLREQEWEKQMAAAHEDEESEEEEPAVVSKPKNAFDMLNEVEEDEDSQIEQEADEDQPAHEQSAESIAYSQPSTSKASKKKKKKAKKKPKSQAETPQPESADEDEIDRALKELNLRKADQQDENAVGQQLWEEEATKHLSIDPKNLDPVNEMRGLFGNIALEDDSRRQQQQPTRRREQNMQGGVDLQTSLSGRYNRASRGKELGALAKRRNCFIQGKEEWPLATSGGLSMDPMPVIDFERHFAIIHNQLYQSAQWDFKMAVESMQAESMISMLQKYPYHITTLLQVSEIAKHQGDSSLSGDLLERALFTFGRTVYHTFPAAMREGRARLDFKKPANRELYLTIWRYIRNLEQRGTWKTAYEWSKILLQLDPVQDPMGVTLMIDQLALRGRQHLQFLDMSAETAYGNTWSHLPNICISKTIALLRAQKPKEARQQLALAMKKYPYILNKLASALDVSPIPKALWKAIPETAGEKLYTELYVTRAKDLWNTPETIGLISEVANTLDYYKVDDTPALPLEISQDDARHIMLLETPALIALLPRKFTNMPTSTTDVLPPPESERDSELVRRAPGHGPAVNHGPGMIETTREAVTNALRWFFAPANTNGNNDENNRAREDAMRSLRQQLGPEGADMPDDVLEQLMQMQIAQQMGDEDVQEVQRGLAESMAGGWDYYNEAAEDGDSDEMPELVSIDDEQEHNQAEAHPAPPVRPHQAMVEEEEDEDAAPRRPTGTADQPILRSANDEVAATAAWIQRSSQQAVQQRSQQPAQSSVPVQQVQQQQPPALADQDIENDPQRLQRWLIGAGLEEVKRGSTNMSTYVRRLKLLRSNQQTWILNMVKQRGSSDLAQRIQSMV